MFLAAALLVTSCNRLTPRTASAQPSTTPSPAELQLKVSTPLRFVAYGDTRFHDPKDTEAANPVARVTLVQAIASVNPAFICFSGDIVYNGQDEDDWKVCTARNSLCRIISSVSPTSKRAATIPSARPTRCSWSSTVLWTNHRGRKANGWQASSTTFRPTWTLFSFCSTIRPTPVPPTKRNSGAAIPRGPALVTPVFAA